MSTKITILVDNTAPAGLVSEHGLSMWIEHGDRRILFDTGQGPALRPNALTLGVDLSAADTLVLSHGHYDHTGGVAHVIEQAPGVDVYFHPGIFRTRYSIRDQNPRSIGIPPQAKTVLESLPAEKLHPVEKPLMLTPDIGLTGPIPRQTSYEDTGGPFYLDRDGTLPDSIEDELALWIETEAGAVTCLGCAHPGVVNALIQVRELTHDMHLRAVLGGFHLINATALRQRQTAATLRLLAPELVAPCHCTGEAATAQLTGALDDTVSPASAGSTYRF